MQIIITYHAINQYWQRLQKPMLLDREISISLKWHVLREERFAENQGMEEPNSPIRTWRERCPNQRDIYQSIEV